MKIAVVGITGMVGQVVLEVLKELKFPVTELIPVASERSLGKSISWDGQSIPIKSMQEAIDARPQIAIFSAGGGTSLEWAPKFAEVGCFVVDNSSAWRMDANIPLVVPEINIHTVTKDTKITGTGMKAVKQYNSEKNGEPVEEPRAYHHPIFENCIPQCDTFLDNGYTKEEMKLVNETKKILGDQSLKITSTAVRVPVHGGHSESVNVEFFNAFDLTELKEILNQSEGIIVQDNPTEFEYPTPLQSKNKNEVFVGRIRRDESKDNALNLWITADNLRKGAATNAVQIAHYLRRFF